MTAGQVYKAKRGYVGDGVAWICFTEENVNSVYNYRMIFFRGFPAPSQSQFQCRAQFLIIRRFVPALAKGNCEIIKVNISLKASV